MVGSLRRIEFDGVIKIGQGLLDVRHLEMLCAPMIISVSPARSELQQLIVIGDGLGVFPPRLVPFRARNKLGNGILGLQ